MVDKKIQALIINELKQKSWGVVEQFLECHSLVMKDGKPKLIEFTDKKKNIYKIFIPVVGQRYYLMFDITCNPSPSIVGVTFEPNTRVYLWIDSNNIDMISKHFNKKFKEILMNSISNSKHGTMLYEPGKNIVMDIESKINNFFLNLEIIKIPLKKIRTTCKMGVNIVYEAYKDSMYGINLPEKFIDQLAQLDLSVDIDLYASGPSLKS